MSKRQIRNLILLCLFIAVVAGLVGLYANELSDFFNTPVTTPQKEN